MSNQILINFVTIVATAIGGMLAKVLIPLIKSWTNNKEWSLIQQIIRTAVAWAEVKFVDEEKAGPEKREAVKHYIEGKGIYLEDEELDVMIDSVLVELGYVKDELKAPNLTQCK